VGPPYFNLIFGALAAPLLLLMPAGPLLSWKRGDLTWALQRLWGAALIAGAVALLTLALVQPRNVVAAVGLGLGTWVIVGAIVEALERVRAFRAPWREVSRRLTGLPRGAWGMTIAHIGIGLFALGAAFETAWRAEDAEALSPGRMMHLSGYELRLDSVGLVAGPNYSAQRALVRVTDESGRLVCEAAPERRMYPANAQTISSVAICSRPLDDVYITVGDERSGPAGSAWLVSAYWNPWVRFVFFGPVVMALGGLLSLSDRRLRFAVPGRARRALAAAPAE
jgi:cytochrome c-type biogenesis protein CcmF